jgi:hypothetical protein
MPHIVTRRNHQFCDHHSIPLDKVKKNRKGAFIRSEMPSPVFRFLAAPRQYASRRSSSNSRSNHCSVNGNMWHIRSIKSAGILCSKDLTTSYAIHRDACIEKTPSFPCPGVPWHTLNQLSNSASIDSSLCHT